MIETLTLAPGVTLRAYRDSRFKQGCLSFQLVRPMQRSQAAANALLPAVLLRGTQYAPSLRAVTQRLDELYGASVSPLVRRVGDYQTVGLFCGFMDDRFALPGDQVLAPMLDFLAQLLLDSPMEDGGFLGDFVESEKKNLIASIESELNDKRVYAMNQLLSNMCVADSYGIPRLGKKEDVAAITPQGLWAHYQKCLRESPIEIFYVGSASADTLAKGLTPVLSRLSRDLQPLAPQSGFRDCPSSHTVEAMDVSQGKLCLGYTTPITNHSPDFPALQVFNTVFGAGMTSKLFQRVREELSLCYTIHSLYYGSKGIVCVYAGIDFDKEDLTRQEVARLLADCQAGAITAEELTAAKEAVLSSLRSTHDSPGAIEGYYATSALSGMALTPEAYMEAVAAVTVADVARVAATVTLHSSYFLKGVNV